MDAIQLLKADHKKVRKLLEDLSQTTTRGTKTRVDLLSRIHDELAAHTTIEEEIFYPAFKKAAKKSDDAKLFYEALEEHRAVGDLVLPDLAKTPADSDQFGGRAKVLKELVEHHIKDEEKEMFPRAKALLSKEELQQLGGQLEARKQQIKKTQR